MAKRSSATKTIMVGQSKAPRSRTHRTSAEMLVVGIGASAGGLEAFRELLEHLPDDTGMALIFIQHLDPRYKSSLPEILGRSTAMPVMEPRRETLLAPNHVYVMPADLDVEVRGRNLHIRPRPVDRARHLPIDHFFQTLAENCGQRAVGVILSGTASDGAIGLGAIKKHGGITMIQDEASAKYDSMPHNAAAAVQADFILPPAKLAENLSQLARQTPSQRQQDRGKVHAVEQTDLTQKVFSMLRAASGVDFTLYKQTTIMRRISHRMQLQKIDNIAQYVQYLQQSPDEINALFEDMLINVTEFFRDPQVFRALKKRVFPRLLRDARGETPIRIWVPGCSSGEEAYSLAICLLEHLAEAGTQSQIQIFATDISELGIQKARSAYYPRQALANMSPDRLRKYFVRTEGGYRVNKSIRDMIVFARQNVVRDAPFSRLDLISCRNLLIYLDASLQKRVMPIFHYALKPHGFLLLGSSETIGNAGELFSAVDRKCKIYQKKSGPSRLPPEMGLNEFAVAAKEPARRAQEEAGGVEMQREVDRIILSRYSPCGAVVDDQMNVIQFRGQTGRFLEPPPGQATLNILKMARQGLLLDLRNSVQKARKERAACRKEGLKVKYNGGFLDVNLEAIPLGDLKAPVRTVLVLFEEVPPRQLAEPHGRKLTEKQLRAEQKESEQLRNELAVTKETLQAIIEEHETSNEELRAANEEIQSSNEELQSTNEELETAKEELQSTNEELSTLNEEMEVRNLELSQANDDLNNLLAAVNIAIVMLDGDLRIRSFTPEAARVLHLLAADVGRGIGDIKLAIQVDDLDRQVAEMMRTLQVVRQEVRDRDGRWYEMTMRPYRTSDNRIEGAVMVLIDISESKTHQEKLEDARAYAEGIVQTLREPLLVLDKDLRVVSANPAFYSKFRANRDNTEGKLVYELGNSQWDIPALRRLLTEIIPQDVQFKGFKVEHGFPRIGHRVMLLNARRIMQKGDRPYLILLAMEDVTHAPNP